MCLCSRNYRQFITVSLAPRPCDRVWQEREWRGWKRERRSFVWRSILSRNPVWQKV
ncbi:hypothetical protein E2C01_081276 [Portunus trituberculatus]|uniref:Uncharacterized protein n=1 Tax=Portunus trituberculatus TaxID=210409 RepID=A0A5B7IYD0_PORTR|nr:hypothetical protein [Portunus trituberculatus]